MGQPWHRRNASPVTRHNVFRSGSAVSHQTNERKLRVMPISERDNASDRALLERLRREPTVTSARRGAPWALKPIESDMKA